MTIHKKIGYYKQINPETYRHFLSNTNKYVQAFLSGKYKKIDNRLLALTKNIELEALDKGEADLNTEELVCCCAEGVILIETGYTKVKAQGATTYCMYLDKEIPEAPTMDRSHNLRSEISISTMPPIIIDDIVTVLEKRGSHQYNQWIQSIINNFGMKAALYRLIGPAARISSSQEGLSYWGEENPDTKRVYDLAALNDNNHLEFTFDEIAQMIELSWPKILKFCEESNWQLCYSGRE